MLLWQLILIQGVTFGLLVFLLRHLFYRQVTGALGRLEQLYQENLKREEELKKAKAEAEQAFKQELARHQEEIRRQKAETEIEIQKMKEKAQAQAKEQGDKIVAEARAKEERMRAKLTVEAESRAVSLASEILKRLFSSKVAEGVHHQLVEGLIEEIRGFNGLDTRSETVDVRLPFPLTAEERTALAQTLSSKVGKLVTLKESSGPEMIAGMIVNLDSIVLDGSLANKLNGMISHVRESIAR